MRKVIGSLLSGLVLLALMPAIPSSSSQVCAQGQCPSKWTNWETGEKCKFTGTTVEHGGIKFCGYDCNGRIVWVHGA